MAGFKTFLMRGNVVDLAVAVVIGAAFTGVVNSVVKGIINPVVGAFGTTDLDNYKSCLKGPCTAGHGVTLAWGSVLGSALNFLITAGVVYFMMVAPMARFLAMRAARNAKAEQEAQDTKATAEAEEVALLREIRDALVHQRTGRETLVEPRGGRDI
ncbi:large conductance mechanosensitive channel protein MscL [Streptomyces sp. PTM05]|uniref:Large conductance mechanosensitive channel protein MscL n=1 Tax=Streptantibioticus parmotrematis TaxID=2873249 RepID=A0ABS7QNE5_9ACTN|nr:large conductance mechanosensitive channel protein MscL [Streptantibioticus parmotrematis]MBY8884694.1 large conductance mechanosensitive channel protein MscL [Streptantibioticus parmotrematis]